MSGHIGIFRIFFCFYPSLNLLPLAWDEIVFHLSFLPVSHMASHCASTLALCASHVSQSLTSHLGSWLRGLLALGLVIV